MQQETQWRVDINPALRDQFQKSLERFGVSQKEGTARLMRWFVSLDPDVQALILRQLSPERSASLAKIILREIAGRGGK